MNLKFNDLDTLEKELEKLPPFHRLALMGAFSILRTLILFLGLRVIASG
jgi:hypothetical protein